MILPALLPLIFGGQLGSAATTVAANLLILRADLRGLRLRAAGDPALGVQRGSPASCARRSACSRRRCRCWRSSPCSRSRARRCGRSSATLSDFAYACTIGLFVAPRRGLPASSASRARRGGSSARRAGRPAADPRAAGQRRARAVRQPGDPGAVRQPRDRRVLRRSSGCSRSTTCVRESWIGTPATNAGLESRSAATTFELTEELLRVAGGLAAFSGFYFAVAMLTDSTYREEFLEELTDEMRASFKARTAYLGCGAGVRHERDDGRGLPPPARQPLRLDRAAQPARLRRDRDLRGDGARARRRGLLLLRHRSTASRRRGSPTAASAGSRSSSSSSPGSPLRLETFDGRGASRGRRPARRSTPAARRCCSPTSTTSTTTATRPTSPATRSSSPATTTRSPTCPTPASRSCRRRGSRTSPRPATARTRCSRSTARCSPCPSRRRARRPARRRAARRSRATRAQMIEPAMGEFEGLPALRRFAAEVGDWPEQLEDWQWSARFCYQVIERRGTGGGNFRLMYSRFLAEAGRDEAALARRGGRRGGPSSRRRCSRRARPRSPTPALWRAVGERAAAVLDAEERLWPALARRRSAERVSAAAAGPRARSARARRTRPGRCRRPSACSEARIVSPES